MWQATLHVCFAHSSPSPAYVHWFLRKVEDEAMPCPLSPDVGYACAVFVEVDLVI